MKPSDQFQIGKNISKFLNFKLFGNSLISKIEEINSYAFHLSLQL